MPAALQIATAPTTEPVTVAEVKSQLNITSSADDTLIGTQITIARSFAEKTARRSLMPQTWDKFLDEWPCDNSIILNRPPLVSVTYIKYTDYAGVVATWDASNYVVDIHKEPGIVALAYGKTWPVVTLTTSSAIQVRYVAGYATAADVAARVPEIKQAILLLTGHLYENREATTELRLEELPLGVAGLLGVDGMTSGLGE